MFQNELFHREICIFQRIKSLVDLFILKYFPFSTNNEKKKLYIYIYIYIYIYTHMYVHMYECACVE